MEYKKKRKRCHFPNQKLIHKLPYRYRSAWTLLLTEKSMDLQTSHKQTTPLNYSARASRSLRLSCWSWKSSKPKKAWFWRFWADGLHHKLANQLFFWGFDGIAKTLRRTLLVHGLKFLRNSWPFVSFCLVAGLL